MGLALTFVLTLNFLFAIGGFFLHMQGVKNSDSRLTKAGFALGALAFVGTGVIAIFVLKSVGLF